MKWSVGITTVPERVYTTLPGTIESLMNAGFSSQVAVCISSGTSSLELTLPTRGKWAFFTNVHSRLGGAIGNWLLTAWELYLDDPHADRYAIFQDDIICSRGLREYLEATTTHTDGYWNCCTYPDNLKDFAANNPPEGWTPAHSPLGLGAQGLVFTNEGIRALLKSPYFVDLVHQTPDRTGIDGIVKSVMGWAGFTEYVHYPSLIAHVNSPSTLGHNPQPESAGFRGPNFDLRTSTYTQSK